MDTDTAQISSPGQLSVPQPPQSEERESPLVIILSFLAGVFCVATITLLFVYQQYRYDKLMNTCFEKLISPLPVETENETL